MIKVRFYGRLKGAIGIHYWHEVMVPDGPVDALAMGLYETHENISGLQLVQ